MPGFRYESVISRDYSSSRAALPAASEPLCRIREYFWPFPSPGLPLALMCLAMNGLADPQPFCNFFACLTRSPSREETAFSRSTGRSAPGGPADRGLRTIPVTLLGRMTSDITRLLSSLHDYRHCSVSAQELLTNRRLQTNNPLTPQRSARCTSRLHYLTFC